MIITNRACVQRPVLDHVGAVDVPHNVPLDAQLREALLDAGRALGGVGGAVHLAISTLPHGNTTRCARQHTTFLTAIGWCVPRSVARNTVPNAPEPGVRHGGTLIPSFLMICHDSGCSIVVFGPTSTSSLPP